MNDKVSHTDDFSPRSFRMLIAKFFGQHVGSLSNNNQLVNDGKEAHFVAFDLLKGFPVGKFIDIVDSFKNMK